MIRESRGQRSRTHSRTSAGEENDIPESQENHLLSGSWSKVIANECTLTVDDNRQTFVTFVSSSVLG